MRLCRWALVGGLAAVLVPGTRLLATGADGTVPIATREAYMQPLPGLGEAHTTAFAQGRALFRQSWVVAPAQDDRVDGLGPLYNRLACVSCHTANGRGRAPDGPDERMRSMLVRLSIAGTGRHGGPRPHPVYGDQLSEEGIPGVPAEGRAQLTWTESRTVLADGEPVVLRRPRVAITELGYGPLGTVMLSPRVGQPVFGLGLLEAVPEETVRAMAREPKPDGVTGRVNRVWDPERRTVRDGRFGWKAGQADLRQQVAAAMIGDIGITSVVFPANNCTPRQTACQAAPDGGHPELSAEQLENVTAYMALLAVPARRDADDPRVRAGQVRFAAAGCAVCHRPELKTGEHRFPALAHRTIAPFTDLLLHDMGEGLADHRPEFRASGRHWRTPALWGIGLSDPISEGSGFLHDGRARTLQEAILWHGGEADAAQRRYRAMSRADRDALIAFLRSL